MYLSHWCLAAKPFDNTADTRFYYPSNAHQGAVLKLRYALEQPGQAALLAGPAGTGKTLLARVLCDQVDERVARRLHLVYPQLPADELLAWLAHELQERSGSGDTAGGVEANLRAIERALVALGPSRHALLVIDEAQTLRDPQTWESLRLLLNLRDVGRGGLSLLIVGETELLPFLERMTSWNDRFAVRSLLRPFSPEETRAYIDHRLMAAGANESPFDEEAIERLWELSRGVPRQINRIADLALLIGYAEDLPSLTAKHIQSVAEELISVAAE